MTMLRGGVALVLVFFGSTGDARAETQPKLAVMPLAVLRGVEPEIGRMLTTSLTTRLSHDTVCDVMGADEAEAMLGLEKLKDALGCDEVVCAAEIGGALGSDFMVTGSIGRLGGRFQVTLVLFDIRAVKVVGRAHQARPDTEDQYEAALDAAVTELLAAAPTLGRLQVSNIFGTLPGQTTDNVMREPPVDTATSTEILVTTDGDGGRLAGQITTSVGGGLLALGGLATYLAMSAARDYEKTWNANDAHSSRAWAATMYTSYATGVAVLGVGLLLWLGAPASEAGGSTPTAMVTPGSFWVGWQGGF